jgi:hypothetical protein
MKYTVAATAAIVLALAATTASAGVVISQDVVVSNQAGERKFQQTVMLQGNKQKVITPERAFITDLDAGKIIILLTSAKKSGEVPFPPTGVVATVMSRQGLFIGFEKGSGTDKVAGYDCQNYAGVEHKGHLDLKVNECVASAAAGAREYVGFKKTMAEKIKNTQMASTGDIPDGIPVSSTVTASLIPFPIPSGFTPEQAAKVKEENAKVKPEITTMTVTKIEVKDLPADTFTVPADYAKPAMPEIPPRKANAAPAATPAAH